MKMFAGILYLLLITTISLNAIIVHGTITQDTVWHVENSPYIVDGFIYVYATLTIEPGVQVLVHAADGNYNWNGFRWHNNNEPTAKMFIVYGKINAIGTAAQPIVFDRYQDNLTWRWGGIYMTDYAPMSTFEHCTFRNTLIGYINSNDVKGGALNFANGILRIRHCTFYDNGACLVSWNLTQPLLIYDCKFIHEHSLAYNYGPCCFGLSGPYSIDNPPPDTFADVTVAKCYFTGTSDPYVAGYYMNKIYINNNYTNLNIRYNNKKSRYTSGYTSLYGNCIENFNKELSCVGLNEPDSVYFRRNTINNLAYQDNVEYGEDTEGEGQLFFSDNTFIGDITLKSGSAGFQHAYIYNNVFLTSALNAVDFGFNDIHGPFMTRVFNNTFVALPEASNENNAIYCLEAEASFFNNTFYGFNNLLDWGSNYLQFRNNIIAKSRRHAFGGGFPEMPLYWNNCFDPAMSLMPNCVNGGGNIYTEPMFADTLNYNFNLTAGSPCIDTGITMDWMPAFDANYNQRITGSAPDMGAYEYKSQYIGGIRGNVYDAHTNQIIDCAQVKISGKLPEFSDTLGCFVYPTGAGTYTVKVTRWDYDDVIIPNVVVTLGQETLLNIAMQDSTVANDDDTLPINDSNISLYNYPNPFKANTKISFILPEKGNTKLEIYNTKGQKVRTLLNGIGQKGYNNISWNGKDDNGNYIASGVYFARVKTGSVIQTHKLVVLK